MKKTISLFLLMLCTAMTIQAIPYDLDKYPWLDRSKSFHERAVLLVKALTLEEKAGQFGSVVTDQVERDGNIILPHYQYWNEAIHGYARMGNATSFPESKGMSATWNPDLIYQCADVTSTEARAYHMYRTNQRNSLVKGWKIGLNVWSPTINMSRDPRWGREEENYGEDPYLCGIMATQFVKGIQGERDETNPYYKIVACAKHFAANNYEQGRHSTTSYVTEKNMREFYLPAFKMCVEQAGVKSVMAAYNAISTNPSDKTAAGAGISDGKGGLPCSGNKMLLTDILRKEWGFNGYVTSDCAAVSDVYRATKHLYFGSYTAGTVKTGATDWKDPYGEATDGDKMMEARATALCLNAGLNSNCEQYSSSAVLQRALRNALSDEYKKADELGFINLTEETVDRALVELLETRFALGEFDEEFVAIPWNNVSESDIEKAEHQALALKAAQESIVLMKNEGSLLPITTDKKVALIGPYANQIMLGDYSGTPTYTTTPFQAFSKKLNFEVQASLQASNLNAVPFTEAVVSKRGAANNDKGAGNLENTAPGDIFLYKDVYFGEDGCTKFEMSCGAKGTGIGTVSFILDNKDNEPFLTVNNKDTGGWTKWQAVSTDFDAAIQAILKGTHDLYVKFGGTKDYCGNYQYFHFWNPNETIIPAEETQGPLYMVQTSNAVNELATDEMIARAVAVAKKADIVVFCGGTDFSKPDSHETGTESHDRWKITLPGNQEDVLKALKQVNSNIVLVLESGSSLDIQWENANIPAILEAWYGGQAQGQAICDAIYGDINPGGKLTSTWYADINELPQANESKIGKNGSQGMMEYNIDEWGYTYMYYGKATKKTQKGTPQYPFGFGLSYTTFDYKNFSIPSSFAMGSEQAVTLDVTNTGTRDGDEVIQIYAAFPGSTVGRPIKKLVGFQRVTVPAGQTVNISIPVKHESFSYYDEGTHTFRTESTAELQIATSSADVDIKKRQTVSTTEGTVGETYISTHIDEIPTYNSKALLQSDHIYSVLGAYVGPADSFDSLPSGVYVLNGVKYIKK